MLSIDATGVNMIASGLREAAPARPGGPQPLSAQLSSRERAGRTPMAVVTACYDAAPAVDPADILPATPGERAGRWPGPKAVNREVDASITDSTIPMTRRLFDRVQQCDPQHQRGWIVLSTATTTRSTASGPKPKLVAKQLKVNRSASRCISSVTKVEESLR